MSEKNLLWDYLVFIVFVIATTFVAVYSRICGTKEKTKADYVFAAGKVSMSAMMLSIARGTIGVRSFLGFPSELYYRGSAMWETLYGMILAYPIVAYVFVPVYFGLDITSVYQYLDLRFKSRLVRCLASGTYVVRQLLNLGVTVFTPCVALNTVIGIPYWASIFGITIISIIFTILGGLKAAILADVMQGLTMIALCLVMIIKGTLEANGFGEVMKKNIDGGRLDFFDWNLDPTIRVTTTSALVGQLFMSLSIFGCQQNFVQRYISMDSQKKVNKTLWCNIPVITVLFSLSWVVGMVIYAIYSDCDPLSSGYIKKYDEILPFFVEDRFNAIPGIMGLFMASLFNGALSLNVSNLNSLATVTFEDFVRPIPAMRDMQDKHQLMAIKIIGVVYGFIIMGISFGVGLLSGVIESSMLVTSATSGPLLGVFVLAMLIPCCNWKGASTGVVLGHIITLWITYGGLTVDKPPTQILPLSVEGCSNSSFNPHVVKHVHAWPVSSAYEFMNRSAQAYAAHPAYKYQLASNHIINATSALPVTLDAITTTTTSLPGVAPSTSDPLTAIYSMTYMYYSLVGCFVTISVGWLVSMLTQSEDDIYDEKLLHPLARKIAAIFPGSKRRYADKTQSWSRNESVRSKNSHVVPPTISPPATITIENKSAAYSQHVPLENEISESNNVFNTRL